MPFAYFLYCICFFPTEISEFLKYLNNKRYSTFVYNKYGNYFPSLSFGFFNTENNIVFSNMHIYIFLKNSFIGL